jgi:hypothetical protein
MVVMSSQDQFVEIDCLLGPKRQFERDFPELPRDFCEDEDLGFEARRVAVVIARGVLDLDFQWQEREDVLENFEGQLGDEALV